MQLTLEMLEKFFEEYGNRCEIPRKMIPREVRDRINQVFGEGSIAQTERAKTS